MSLDVSGCYLDDHVIFNSLPARETTPVTICLRPYLEKPCFGFL